MQRYVAVATLFRLPHYSPVGSIGNVGFGKTVGNDGNGRIASRKRSGFHKYGVWCGCGRQTQHDLIFKPRRGPDARSIAYMAGAEIPGLIVNVQRGGPGLGTIQPSQSDYFQATRGGGNGDYNVIVLAPASVQEMADFVDLAFELSFKYRNPAMILSDGVIGQMMEKLVLPPFKPRRTEEEIRRECPWAAMGRSQGRRPNVLTSLDLDSASMEQKEPAFASQIQRNQGKKKSASNPSCATTRSI